MWLSHLASALAHKAKATFASPHSTVGRTRRKWRGDCRSSSRLAVRGIALDTVTTLGIELPRGKLAIAGSFLSMAPDLSRVLPAHFTLRIVASERWFFAGENVRQKVSHCRVDWQRHDRLGWNQPNDL